MEGEEEKKERESEGTEDDIEKRRRDKGSFSLPHGVEESVWTALEVDLLGTTKKIVQIQTKFVTPPYFVRSSVCPRSLATDLCPTSTADFDTSDDPIDGSIPLRVNETLLHSQSPNEYTMFSYVIAGDPCTTSVKVCELCLYVCVSVMSLCLCSFVCVCECESLSMFMFCI